MLQKENLSASQGFDQSVLTESHLHRLMPSKDQTLNIGCSNKPAIQKSPNHQFREISGCQHLNTALKGGSHEGIPRARE